MTLPEGLTVVESPKQMLLGTSRAYGIDFSNLGIPVTAGDTIVYNESGTEVGGSMLSGTASQAGSIITLEEFEPTAVGSYRIVHQVSIGAQTVFGVLDVEVFATIPPSAGDRTPSAGTYSTVEEVAALVPRYATRRGTFDDTTRPVVQSVVTYLQQVSGVLNAILAREGFVVPVTEASVKLAIDLFTAQEVASIVEGINGSGRFGPTSKTGGGRGRFALVFDDAEEFIEANALGFERMGADRTYSIGSSIGYRDIDESGDDIYPIRQRKEFGDTFTDWDN